MKYRGILLCMLYVQLYAMSKEHVSGFFIKKNKNGTCLVSFEKICNTIERRYTMKMETLTYKYFIISSSINDVHLEYLENDCAMKSADPVRFYELPDTTGENTSLLLINEDHIVNVCIDKP